MSKEINGVPFSMGNKKLPKTTAIFNMGTAKDCPSKTLGLCQCEGVCYARKSEICYKFVIPFRERQRDAFISKSADKIADAIIKGGTIKTPIKQFRFSEAGDFVDQKAVNKMTGVCKVLKENGIDSYGYTARKDLNLTGLQKVATVQGSGFMATNNFKFIPKGSTTETCDKVCAGDCRICNLCWKGKGLVIGVPQH